MGKLKNSRFERNWTTFVNRLFTLLGKAQPKWWYETPLVGFDPKGVFSLRPDGESRKNAFWTQLDDLRQPAFYASRKSPAKMVVWDPPRRIRSQGFFFVSPRWGTSKKRVLNVIERPSSTRLFTLLGKAQPKWWYETHLVGFDPTGVFSFRPDGESRKNAFWAQLDELRQRAFYAAWKSPAKMVVWNPPRGIRSQGCFYVSPRWGKSKKRVLNAIWRPSYTRLFALLGKAQPKWW